MKKEEVKEHTKFSFAPISNPEITVLILGSLPGEKSLELGEYYAHSQNRFWKIISSISEQKLPITYVEKKQLLLFAKIALWDVAHQATRMGSLDSAIKNEQPNNLPLFISKHKNLKIIAFNGIKAQQLHDKYFDRKKDLKYLSLPSTSPANARINFETICAQWKKLVTE